MSHDREPELPASEPTKVPPNETPTARQPSWFANLFGFARSLVPKRADYATHPFRSRVVTGLLIGAGMVLGYVVLVFEAVMVWALVPGAGPGIALHLFWLLASLTKVLGTPWNSLLQAWLPDFGWMVGTIANGTLVGALCGLWAMLPSDSKEDLRP